jgi:hypothetical protein
MASGVTVPALIDGGCRLAKGREAGTAVRTAEARRRLVRRTIFRRGRGYRQFRCAAARTGRVFQVPASVETTAAGGVVPGELGAAVIRGTGSSVAEAAHRRLGVRAAAPAFPEHDHTESVPFARARQTCVLNPGLDSAGEFWLLVGVSNRPRDYQPSHRHESGRSLTAT